MRRLVAAEFVKLATTRLWLWLLIASVAMTVLFAALAIGYSDAPDNPTPRLTTAAGQRTLLQVGSAAGTLVAVLAAIGVTGELRHRTAVATFLATPRRARVLLAKLITYGCVGVGYALVCIAATVAVALPWLDSRGIDIRLDENGIPSTLFGVVVALALYGFIGAGLGALIGDQVATVVGLLIYLFVVEPVVTRISALESWSVFLPGASANALTQVAQAGQEFLPPWVGGVVLAGYALAINAAGNLRLSRRDLA